MTEKVDRLLDLMDELKEVHRKIEIADGSSELLDKSFFKLDNLILDELRIRIETRERVEMGEKIEMSAIIGYPDGIDIYIDSIEYFQAYRKDELDRKLLLYNLRTNIFKSRNELEGQLK